MSRFLWIPLIAFPLLVVGFKYWWDIAQLSPGQNEVQLTDYIKEAIQFKRQQINSLAQLSILLVGALWGLVIGAKRTPSRLGLRSWIVFGSANVSLVVSYLLYLRAINQLVEYLFKAENIDLYSPKVSLYSSYQTATFSMGLSYALLFALVFVCIRSREEP